jgi:CcmD family protein
MNAPSPFQGPAAPESSAGATAPEDRASAFRAAQGPSEQVPGGKLLVAAYAVVWVVLLLVVIRVFRRQSAVEKQAERLEAAIKRAAGTKGDA